MSITTLHSNMAKNRMVNTKFWDDQYIANLKPTEKLLFLYLLTNPLTNIAGVYELSVRRMAFDIGLSEKEIGAILSQLQADGKIFYEAPWVAVRNFVRHQSLNPKVMRGISIALDGAPKRITSQLDLPMKVSLMMRHGSRTSMERGRGGVRHIGELIKG